jgi:ATP-binding cassette, subfamily B, bacterial MsbA
MPTLLQRIARLWPYFVRQARDWWWRAGLADHRPTEPVIPALMKPLLDQGFGQASMPLWLVPVVIIGLFVGAQRGRLRGPVRAGLDGQRAAC